ncbi:hypothetical protein PR202_ga11391 [Eleusine coracana subsp. coracana]|uniref:F-box associated beta-propeller type 3 domain-containing protein n=1 Tax=Eleusine coracana subsp. coracana TaxID=191504 RepID=A0AAV5C935_ELECO|nr:hypothetical protein PR202_ga11391 [Eleusine coracana subsp. coracana]
MASKNPFYICNPAMRQWAAIPKLRGYNVAALYHHSSSGEYRILCWKGCLSDAHYYVLTVGSSLEPRYIGRFVASDRPPILLHNCLHWHLNVGPIRGLLVFDTIVESLKCIRPPATHNWCYAAVLEMDGLLGVSCTRHDYTMVDLWVLQDYKTEMWSMKYQLELPVAELTSIGKSDKFTASIVSDYGDMLVVVGGDMHLFYCDSKGKLLQHFRWDHVFPRPTDGTLWNNNFTTVHHFVSVELGSSL